ncbi:hypothetical protein LCGC14_0654770, partial [marine sediment metagenome]
IDSMWFSNSLGHFGIVVSENETGERKLFAGIVSGHDQKVDEQTILDWGNRVNISLLEGLIAKSKSK